MRTTKRINSLHDMSSREDHSKYYPKIYVKNRVKSEEKKNRNRPLEF